jgi:hypothetical protein
MDNRGQHFDTFKLLIAAIVAVAILGILLAIIGPIGPPNQDPTSSAVSLISSIQNNPGQMQPSGAVTFEPSTNLNSVSLEARTSMSRNQFCLSLGPFENDSQFELRSSPHHEIIWKGAVSKTVKMAAYCDLSGTAVQEYISERLNSEIDCSNCGEQKCCAVVLRYNQ